ncbi:natterin-3-like [Pelmatolapia mariae]|uniref:natterin-3-like n=1 Tax=Pelmatolapia mariae TaxID=158779 RepID=UPI002FE684F3
MMLSLLLLLALSPASPQGTVKKHSENRNVTSLNPDLDRAPEMTDISVNTSVYQHLLFPAKMKQKRQAFDNKGSVKWQTWNNSLPDGAVAIYNTYEERTDYVCKYGCHAGFYSRSLGDFCHYPCGGREHRTDSFDILVNEDNFGILEWKKGYRGSVSKHAVRTCSSDELYVGKNEYGLGKVHPRRRSFFLPWGGKVYLYESYEVLTINRDVDSETISDVRYKTNDAKIIEYPPETMQISSSDNKECNPVTKTVTLSKTVRDEKRWDISTSVSVGVTTTFTTGIPNVASKSFQVSGQFTFDYSKGATHAKELSHTVEEQVSVPPNHSCKVKMLAYWYNVNIPFTALLTRNYRNKTIERLNISGTYYSIQTGEVRAVVERCEYLTSVQPCLQIHNNTPNLLPATDCQPAHGAPHLSPCGSWGRLQLPCDPELDK